MIIHIQNKQKVLPLTRQKAKLNALVHFVTLKEKRRCDEIGIFFITDAAMRKLHKEFFNDDSPTDCISFPVDSENETGHTYLGDIFVCPEAAFSYPDPYSETSLYVLHGLLHLLGYDDMDAKSRKIMRKREKTYMTHLRQMGLIFNANP